MGHNSVEGKQKHGQLDILMLILHCTFQLKQISAFTCHSTDKMIITLSPRAAALPIKTRTNLRYDRVHWDLQGKQNMNTFSLIQIKLFCIYVIYFF